MRPFRRIIESIVASLRRDAEPQLVIRGSDLLFLDALFARAAGRSADRRNRAARRLRRRLDQIARQYSPEIPRSQRHLLTLDAASCSALSDKIRLDFFLEGCASGRSVVAMEISCRLQGGVWLPFSSCLVQTATARVASQIDGREQIVAELIKEGLPATATPAQVSKAIAGLAPTLGPNLEVVELAILENSLDALFPELYAIEPNYEIMLPESRMCTQAVEYASQRITPVLQEIFGQFAQTVPGRHADIVSGEIGNACRQVEAELRRVSELQRTMDEFVPGWFAQQASLQPEPQVVPPMAAPPIQQVQRGREPQRRNDNSLVVDHGVQRPWLQPA